MRAPSATQSDQFNMFSITSLRVDAALSSFRLTRSVGQAVASIHPLEKEGGANVSAVVSEQSPMSINMNM